MSYLQTCLSNEIHKSNKTHIYTTYTHQSGAINCYILCILFSANNELFAIKALYLKTSATEYRNINIHHVTREDGNEINK